MSTREPQYVVVSGNPIQGMEIIGVFTSAGDALNYLDLMKEEGWVVELEYPKRDN
jgi:hypothetical protein